MTNQEIISFKMMAYREACQYSDIPLEQRVETLREILEQNSIDATFLDRLISKETSPIPIGSAARKVGGNYQSEGFIQAAFKADDGTWRYVFQFYEPKGLLHIFTEKQVEAV